MARNDDPGDYPESEPTQYASYGDTGGEAYSEYGGPAYRDPVGFGQAPAPLPRTAWHQKPAALVGLGVLSAAILARQLVKLGTLPAKQITFALVASTYFMRFPPFWVRKSA